MKRSHLILFIGGALVAAGMVISFYGSKLTTQDMAVAEGQVAVGAALEVTKALDPDVADTGVFVVQAENFEQGSMHATVFDPAGGQVASKEIEQKSTEVTFQIESKGDHRLVVENSGAVVSAIIGITHMPQKSVLLLNVLGQAIIISGFVGLGIALLYIILGRKKSV
jgi:tetrahydromethanopterin S-methyltransferase subunit A